jgi:hypothetical protein
VARPSTKTEHEAMPWSLDVNNKQAKTAGEHVAAFAQQQPRGAPGGGAFDLLPR